MRTYDLIVYGATGFTGRQAAERVAAMAPAGLRWAIGGRDRARLEDVARSLPNPPDVVVADGQDEAALAHLAASTSVILTTAGPFARHGDKLVAAAVAHQTHYVDITGESPWVATLIERFHDQAAADGTRIVPFCGFDSIPSDLGVFQLARHVQATRGCGVRRIVGSFSMKGGVNGGTMASALNMAETGQSKRLLRGTLLQPEGTRRVAGPDRRSVDWDPTRRRHLLPFFMAPINTRVVGRSATLLAADGEGYGEAFTYEEAMETKGAVGAWTMTLGMGMADALLKRPWGRGLVARAVPKPGEGPSTGAMDGGFFRARFTAEAEDGSTAWGVVADMHGDPGNRSTVRMLVQSALCLLQDRDRLPQRAGVLTPALAFGAVLPERLAADGMRWETGDGALPG
jgi:short subunit dehydrogenase-like uncharacterized protein